MHRVVHTATRCWHGFKGRRGTAAVDRLFSKLALCCQRPLHGFQLLQGQPWPVLKCWHVPHLRLHLSAPPFGGLTSKGELQVRSSNLARTAPHHSGAGPHNFSQIPRKAFRNPVGEGLFRCIT